MQWLMTQVLKLHPWTTCPDPARGDGQAQARPYLPIKVQSLFQIQVPGLWIQPRDLLEPQVEGCCASIKVGPGQSCRAGL